MLCRCDSVLFMTRFEMILLLVLVACGGIPEGPQEGQRAPSFTAARMDGGTITLDDYRGKPTVLVFWASWCGPCRKEAPDVVRVAKSYGNRVNLVGINAGESVDVAKRAAPQLGITWPVVLDPKGKIQSQYEVTGIPLVMILDADGRVRHRNNGIPSDIHRLLDGLLG